MAKEIIGNTFFKEVFMDASLEVCIAIDTKELYKKALNGVNDFTCISSPYKQPITVCLMNQIFEWLISEQLIYVETF